MRHFVLVFTLALSTIISTPTASAFVNAKPDAPKIYVQADTNFTTSLTAALMKKGVPVTIIEDKVGADYVLESATVNSKEESTGGKIARCLFMDCIGMNGFSEVSVKLVRTSDSAVVWAYQVRKGASGPVAIQSLSEAIAKHLKNDYLSKQK
jgi:hypothetical protein